jgi:hypothetical protein
MSITLSSALRALPNVKATALARAFLVSDDVGYAVLRGEWDSRFTKCRHAIATLPSPVSDAVLSALLNGTGYSMPQRISVDGDVNADGRVNADDVRAGLVRIAKTACGELEAAMSDGSVHSADRAAHLHNALSGFERVIDQVRAALEQTTARPSLRSA